ncbi:MAG: flagellar type III secretion system pore protein FliP [Sedimentisphaerales bacterium]|nr:flagellar type III secretion system pore protein FliP [Sedimentisphaerales bacterium]
MTSKLLVIALISTVCASVQAQAVAISSSNTTATTKGETDAGAALAENLDPARLVENATKPEKLSSSLEIMLLLTVLSLAPAVLVMTTCFTRIVVVLALLRQAMATNQLPPAQVITGLALFMTFCVMAPTWKQIHADAIAPYIDPSEGVAAIDRGEAWRRAQVHMRRFMITQIENNGNEEDVYMFAEFSSPDAVMQEKIRNETLQWSDVPLTTLIPAFITSELKQAFLMGFYIYLPFLVIDMVIASILMSMGMMMLPPVLISLPFKLLLFVLVDGWHLVVGTLMAGFTNNVAL